METHLSPKTLNCFGGCRALDVIHGAPSCTAHVNLHLHLKSTAMQQVASNVFGAVESSPKPEGSSLMTLGSRTCKANRASYQDIENPKRSVVSVNSSQNRQPVESYALHLETADHEASNSKI